MYTVHGSGFSLFRSLGWGTYSPLLLLKALHSSRLHYYREGVASGIEATSAGCLTVSCNQDSAHRAEYNSLTLGIVRLIGNGPYSQWHLRGTVGEIVWQSGAKCSIFTSPSWQFSTSSPRLWPGNRKNHIFLRFPGLFSGKCTPEWRMWIRAIGAQLVKAMYGHDVLHIDWPGYS